MSYGDYYGKAFTNIKAPATGTILVRESLVDPETEFSTLDKRSKIIRVYFNLIRSNGKNYIDFPLTEDLLNRLFEALTDITYSDENLLSISVKNNVNKGMLYDELRLN